MVKKIIVNVQSITGKYLGFYAMSIAWVCIGAVWLIWGWRTVKNLQLEERDTWRVIKKKGEAENQKIEERRKFNYFYCF